MPRYCANCGTEVDDSAVFCPTCGQPIDEASETEIPAAPAWPESTPSGRASEAPPTAFEAADPSAATPASPPPDEPVTRVEPSQAPPPAVPPPAAAQGRAGGPAVNLPITTPVTLSGWLIGGGSALAALGVLIGLFDLFLNPVELILLVALVAIAATVFFSANLPTIPNLRLATLVVVLIGFGIALDRLGTGGAGAGELLLFLGTAMAAIGAILLELGQDQPLGGAGG